MTAPFWLDMCSLRKAYGDRVVLDVDGLRLQSDCAYALVGPNGSGKSTLCKVLSGTVDQTSGYVEVGGGASRDELAVGYMPQKSYVFGFSVFKNVSLALGSSGLAKDEVERRVNERVRA